VSCPTEAYSKQTPRHSARGAKAVIPRGPKRSRGIHRATHRHSARSARAVIPRGAKRSRGIHRDHQTPARNGAPKARPNSSPGQRPGKFVPCRNPKPCRGGPFIPNERGSDTLGRPFRAGAVCSSHGSRGDAPGFHGPPRWGLLYLTTPDTNPNRRRVSETPRNRRLNFIADSPDRFFHRIPAIQAA
jgi:hypothetical protein